MEAEWKQNKNMLRINGNYDSPVTETDTNNLKQDLEMFGYTYSPEKIKSVQWGRENETYALEWASDVIKKPIKKCDLFLHPSECSGASHIGIVDDKAIVEIKCPIKYRNGGMKNSLKEDDSYIIYYNNDALGDLKSKY
ncbi:hypothetical protein HELRODRAFT_167025 [Helobdella robusta]|uniref:YqaJ viral recombinase domain-containing protein n=1 Tax=Helobdella robusta TaxID=6412 RepID=T1EYW9_HELRO|nr:hypothetical protein HELRODRAFT_167025 [Helobdella robusta]ESO11930.1 hypothetical protein HELRODRAFT_167025 [Helobdella robusta]